MNVKYLGAWGDYSGYGEASRNAIRALLKAGVNVTAQRVTHQRESTSYGQAFTDISLVEGKPIDYQIKIIHITPDGYLKHLEPMKYHIGHLFWETSALPPEWVWNCNLMDEIWTGDEYHAKAMRESGVTSPIYVMPQAIETDIKIPKPFELRFQHKFWFYSIFQWIERKNPKALLSAYWKTFNENDDVGLLIKTYGKDFSKGETAKIYEEIALWKTQQPQGYYPPVYIYDRLMSRADVFRFHVTGDCFVLPHRGEGWGIPQVEAGLMGNPVISTDLGGMHSHVFSPWYLRNHKMVNVFNMDFVPWYREEQLWAEIDMNELCNRLREAYKKPHTGRQIGDTLREDIKHFLSYEKVGEQMRKRLEQIKVNY